MTITGLVAFCDDIRFENNGKALIIGLYSEDLVPGTLPQQLPLSFWVRVKGLPAGETNLVLTVGANDKVQHRLNVHLVSLAPDRAANLYLVGVPVEIGEPGTVFLELSGFPDGSALRDTLIVTQQNEQFLERT